MNRLFFSPLISWIHIVMCLFRHLEKRHKSTKKGTVVTLRGHEWPVEDSESKGVLDASSIHSYVFCFCIHFQICLSKYITD